MLSYLEHNLTLAPETQCIITTLRVIGVLGPDTASIQLPIRVRKQDRCRMKQDHLPVPILRTAMLIMPAGLLQGMIDILLQSMRRRHPSLFRDLARLDGAIIRIEPSDLPHQFVLKYGQGSTTLTVTGPQGHSGDTCVRGKLGALLSLLEGQTDSDKLFFSREIEITGDTSVIVTLRNTLDREEINLLDDMAALCGPLATPARVVASFVGATA
jgi:predicted lipid carrier protein YhbT